MHILSKDILKNMGTCKNPQNLSSFCNSKASGVSIFCTLRNAHGTPFGSDGPDGVLSLVPSSDGGLLLLPQPEEPAAAAADELVLPIFPIPSVCRRTLCARFR